MSGFDMLPEQRAVVVSDEPKFTVRAAAGSGKTSVLVARYLRLVAEGGLRPDQILTITYTRKAAFSMKRRIVAALRGAGLFEQAQSAETGPIATIHSFCERTLRENAIAAGIDPSFEVLGEGRSPALREEALRAVLAEPGRVGPLGEAYVISRAGERTYRSVAFYAQIGWEVDGVLDRLRGSGWTPARLLDLYADEASTLRHWAKQALAGLEPEHADLAAGLAPEAIPSALNRLIRQRKPKWLSQSGMPDHEVQAACLTAGLMEVAALVWQELERRMTQRQVFDFTLMESLAVRLVHEEPEVAARLRAQYRAVLVDEAQDLNPVQHGLLSVLDALHEMRVGDPQQSIYGFRLADVELFRRHSEDTPTLEMHANHRSGEGVLQFVDELFAPLMGLSYRPMSVARRTFDLEDPVVPSFDGVELWVQHPDLTQTASWIAEMVADGEDPSDIAVLTRRNDTVHDLAERLEERGIRTRRLGAAETFYTRLEVRDLANALEAVADPYADEALLAVLHSPLCGLKLDSIVLLADAARERSVYEALDNTALVDEEDEIRSRAFLAWFDALAGHADRLPAWEALAQVLSQSGYEVQVARTAGAGQALANVRKLLSLLAQEPELGSMAGAEWLRDIRLLRHKEGDAPAHDEDEPGVVLTTIHKAKGLEWPVVVLPETFDRPRKPSGVLVDAKSAYVALRPDRQVSAYWSCVAERLRAAESAESHRLLYVAMTRAKRRLCVVVSRTADESTWAGLVARRMRIEDRIPPGLRLREVE